MAFDTSKTILLEKQYLYVRASKGFQLEGTSTERIWTNTGYYRFLVDNVAKSIGNSYVKVIYDSSDLDFIAYCSDLFMEEIQNTIVVAVENIQTVLEDFAEQNHEDITDLSQGLSSSLEYLVKSTVFDKFSPIDVVHVSSYDSYSTLTLDVDEECIVFCSDHHYINGSKEFFTSGLKFANVGKYLVLSADGKFFCLNVADATQFKFQTPSDGALYRIRRIV